MNTPLNAPNPLPPNRPGYGVVVGRFQCDQLTVGHLALLSTVSTLHAGRLIIIVGCLRGPHNATNPLSYEIREAMIRQAFPDAIIRPLKDCRENVEWSEELDKLVANTTGHDGARLYSGRDGFLPWYTGNYPTEEIHTGIECSATDIRAQIAKKHPNDVNRAFREGIIYAHMTRVHQDYQTVDIALLRNDPATGNLQVVLGRKPNEKQWRFPGGFVEPQELVIQAGIRELGEETHGAAVNDAFDILDEFIIDDWRVRRQKGVGHKGWLVAGMWDGISEISAGDDLAEAEWWDVRHVDANAEKLLMVEHRRDMFSRLVSYCYERGLLQPQPVNA